MELYSSLLTPNQAATYLQVNRDTIYRYIKDGRLVATRLGRGYRIPKASLARLLWQSRSWNRVQLREYTDEEIAAFLRDDVLTDEEKAIVAEITCDEQPA